MLSLHGVVDRSSYLHAALLEAVVLLRNVFVLRRALARMTWFIDIWHSQGARSPRTVLRSKHTALCRQLVRLVAQDMPPEVLVSYGRMRGHTPIVVDALRGERRKTNV